MKKRNRQVEEIEETVEEVEETEETEEETEEVEETGESTPGACPRRRVTHWEGGDWSIDKISHAVPIGNDGSVVHVPVYATQHGDVLHTAVSLTAAREWLRGRGVAALQTRSPSRACPTLRIVRIVSALDALIERRPTEALANARQWLDTELAAHTAAGVDVAAVRATEAARIARVQAARSKSGAER